MGQRVLDGGHTAVVGRTDAPADVFSPWVEIDVGALVGSPICIALEKGEIVHQAIAREWVRGNRVRLSFETVDDISTVFMWAAVGQFLETRSRQFVMERVELVDEDYHKRSLFERVLRNAERFHRSPDLIKRILREDLGDDEEEV